MSLLPDTKVGRIEWAENHVAAWTANGVAMGSSSAAVTAWSALVSSARTKYEDQQAAQSAAKDATTDLNIVLQQMMDSTASIIKQVRAKAQLSGDGIYSLASLPVPPTPAPVPAPGKPFELTVALSEIGALNLKWKCNNPTGGRGTIYQIWRQIGEAGTLEYIGGSGSKEFTDSTLPAGSMNVMYQMQAVRSTAVGEWATFNVKFGTGSGGGMTATVEEATVKKAA